MSRYRKVDSRIWNDAKFCALGDDGKLLFLMLLTHPNMTALGAMRGTPGGLAEEIGWPVERLREAFGEVLAKALARHDGKAHLIALPNFLKYNAPESPNVVKAWVGSLDQLPECDLKTQVLLGARSLSGSLPEAFRKAFEEAFAKAMPNQEPEPEQEPEPDKEFIQEQDSKSALRAVRGGRA